MFIDQLPLNRLKNPINLFTVTQNCMNNKTGFSNASYCRFIVFIIKYHAHLCYTVMRADVKRHQRKA